VKQSYSNISVCCWQGGHWLGATWIRVAAARDAVARFSSAEWVVLVDTDTVPRHLVWSPTAVAGWTASQSLRRRCRDDGGSCFGVQPVSDHSASAAIVIARGNEIYDPKHERSGNRANPGVLFVRGQGAGGAAAARAQELLDAWWASRDADCDVPCGLSRRAPCGSCPCDLMTRVGAMQELTALGRSVMPRYAEADVAEVPHSLLSSPSGAMWAHWYNWKWRMRGEACASPRSDRRPNANVCRLFLEAAARHVAGALRLTCPGLWAGREGWDCGHPSTAGTTDGGWRCVRAGRAWAGSLFASVRSIPLSLGNDSRVRRDRQCQHKLSHFIRHSQQPEKKGRRGADPCARVGAPSRCRRR